MFYLYFREKGLWLSWLEEPKLLSGGGGGVQILKSFWRSSQNYFVLGFVLKFTQLAIFLNVSGGLETQNNS
jgi:hypothetical protein